MKWKSRDNNFMKAFTLIELLIVVAIIAILAAIAVPNFLEAQTRAKISRAKADMKTMVTAHEMYHIDYNKYIDAVTNSDLIDHANAACEPAFAPAYSALKALSSPIAYLSTVPRQAPFQDFEGFNAYGYPKPKGFQYTGGENQWMKSRRIYDVMPNGPWWPRSYHDVVYYFNCIGPTKVYSAKANNSSSNYPRIIPYNATNGTVSTGDIIYASGNPGGWHSFK